MLLELLVFFGGRWKEATGGGSSSEMSCTFGGLRPPVMLKTLFVAKILCVSL